MGVITQLLAFSIMIIRAILFLAFIFNCFIFLKTPHSSFFEIFIGVITDLAGIFAFPILLLYKFAAFLIPEISNPYFPVAKVILFEHFVDSFFKQVPILRFLDFRPHLYSQVIPGSFHWLFLLALPFWDAVQKIWDYIDSVLSHYFKTVEKEEEKKKLSLSFLMPQKPQKQAYKLKGPPNELVDVVRDLRSELDTVKRRVHTDPLTGLYNRAYLNAKLEKKIEEASQYEGHLGLILLDIDNFKKLNDQYGHVIGDKALVLVSQLLLEVCQIAQKPIPCRYGGEEMVIMYPDEFSGTVVDFAEQICKKVNQLKIPEHPEITLSVSIGVFTVVFNASNSSYLLTPSKMIEESDKQMYKAKQSGKNRVVSKILK
jgi:diguanylate cyclase (GGDEF)-like protein